MSPSCLWTEMSAQCNNLSNITNNDALVRKMLFVKMEGLVGWAQQMVADHEAAKREWEEMSSTMRLSSGTMLNKTEVLVNCFPTGATFRATLWVFSLVRLFLSNFSHSKDRSEVIGLFQNDQ